MSELAMISSGRPALCMMESDMPRERFLRSKTSAAPGGRFSNQLEESAKQLVASALITPLLEQMQTSPLRPENGPFAQNVVEKRFGPIMNHNLADRMMASQSFGLVEAVMQQMQRTGDVEVIA